MSFRRQPDSCASDPRSGRARLRDRPQHVPRQGTKLFARSRTRASAFCNWERSRDGHERMRERPGRTDSDVPGAYHASSTSNVRATASESTRAPGIMPSASQNVLVLDYGTPESMEILKSRMHELAAVIVEPVQSRRPDFQPVEFLRELRELTRQHGTVFIWDEVVCGFRAHPAVRRGCSASMRPSRPTARRRRRLPVGVIAGKRELWTARRRPLQFGDDSIPRSASPTSPAPSCAIRSRSPRSARARAREGAGPALQERSREGRADGRRGQRAHAGDRRAVNSTRSRRCGATCSPRLPTTTSSTR